MAEPTTISPEEPVNKGMDYPALKEEGLRLVQQLSSDIWTDYNEHDPGVTTLEQLCYALTELSYRAELPLEDLLIDRQTRRINTRQQALFIPRRILTCNPLTENDYRKLLVDRIPQIANIWLTPYRSPFINGLYDMTVYAPGVDPCACDPAFLPEAIRKRVLRVYCRHRDLCENVHAIRFVKPVPTIVYADVNIDETLTPEAILANLFFALGNFLAPELRRQSLKSLLDAGRTGDEIFNGPLLRNGFISDDQLQPKATLIPVQEIIRVMAGSAGVISVRDVSVVVGPDGKTYPSNASIEVRELEILQLDTRSNIRDGGYSLRLFKNGIQCAPDPARVKRELDKLWTDYRRAYRLLPQYEEFFAIPRGVYRDVENYYSIQNQYPNVYGINHSGLPDDATIARRGQAKQLKGYLLVFEQLLADFFAQLAHAKDLYSTEPGLHHTYFYQYLSRSVPDVEPLLKENYRGGLELLTYSQDPALARRNRFLDFLLALYAEQLNSSSVSELAGCGKQDENSGEELMRVKLALLRNMIASTHNRGRGIDYLALPTARNIAGMEIKCRIQLGMNVYDNRPLVEALDEYGVELVETDASGSVGRALSRFSDHIEEQFTPIKFSTDESASASENEQPLAPVNPLQPARPLTEEFLRAAEHVENFRVGSLPGESAVALVCKSPSENDWHMIGRYTDIQSATAAVGPLVKQMSALYRLSQQLYIVEHTLLWNPPLKRDGDAPFDEEAEAAQSSDDKALARHDAATAAPEDDFVYSFTITAVVSALPRQLSSSDYQTIVREVVRQNTPAHIVVNFCFLRPMQMRQFETLYWDWRRALRHRARREIINTSDDLRDFLEQCQLGPDGQLTTQPEGRDRSWRETHQR
ncbi:MAG: hypothetical protein QOF02_488 [Blastocatellia bacterium]|jgi:hypothetical protein|nr:hypothetical protein [Blastocatellia bacterium]